MSTGYITEVERIEGDVIVPAVCKGPAISPPDVGAPIIPAVRLLLGNYQRRLRCYIYLVFIDNRRTQWSIEKGIPFIHSARGSV
ncbi:hypothetical protein OUZ56_030285 [Daphnia magna]|uniref:Uncharacterized protein n=1 Tax=Daphnia magna TaxID=35525 RepID=A0ABQ9ZQV0_9CRUS|nr:hypothetical protein OUZ56_030285 [Daphnia magna]